MPASDPAADADVLVIGGGVVGMCLAWGLAQHALQVAVLDEGDFAFRASRGNFGLVWVQAKGVGLPRYAEWSRDAAALWPSFARQLTEATGIDLGLRQPGGFCLCHSADELERRYAVLAALQAAVRGDYPFEMLDQAALRDRLPGVGPAVAGASFTPMDGHVNPLRLLRALHQACADRGVRLHNGVRVERLDPGRQGFTATDAATGRRFRGRRLVLAAGLGIAGLAGQVGLHAPVVPNRGQVLVTERLQPFLHHPTNKLRQTDEGTVQIGDTVEDVGFDDGLTPDALQFMAARAVRSFPRLADVRMVRAWGALRVMSPDGFPIYQESAQWPGAYVVTCHSGVTLAAAHAGRIAPWIAGSAPLPEGLQALTGERFRQAGRHSMYVNG